MGIKSSALEIMEGIKGKVNASFWKDKKVFLTGHTGFKGSWLSLWLQSMGATVKGYSLNPPTDLQHARIHVMLGEFHSCA